MPRVGFEPLTPAIKRPQIYALDRAATGIGHEEIYKKGIMMLSKSVKRFLTYLDGEFKT
jgi:hypothetical protein